MKTSPQFATLLHGMPRQPVTADGLPRSQEDENRIDGAFKALAASPFGATILDYLAGITVQAVMLPSVSDAELRHMEGMRALYAIVRTRVERASK